MPPIIYDVSWPLTLEYLRRGGVGEGGVLSEVYSKVEDSLFNLGLGKREHSERLTGLSKRAIAKVTLTHGVLVILH